MSFDVLGFLASIVALVVSFSISFAVKIHAAQLQLIQFPNARSSHGVPTPSGGGIGIIVAGIVASPLILPLGSSEYTILTAAVMAGILGGVDDRFDLSARMRFGIHVVIVATLLTLFKLAWLAPANAAGAAPAMYFFVALLAGVWWINLFNFMDGIDGLAASQAVFMLLGSVSIAYFSSANIEGSALVWPLVLAAATGGFLVLNWAPAKIFMGDVGSNFLAVAILGTGIYLVSRNLVDFVAILVLPAMLVSDATVTLVTRILLRQRWWVAHRSHAYQRLSRRWGGHARVTLLYLAISVFWLYPLAHLAATQPNLSWIVAVIAYGPVLVFCVWAGAGRGDANSKKQ